MSPTATSATKSAVPELVSSAGIIVIVVMAVLLALFIIFYALDFFRMREQVSKFLVFIRKYLFLVFTLPAVVILVVHLLYGNILTSDAKAYNFIFELSKIAFSAGIFTTSLSYLDSLDMFKKKVNEIIISDDFSKVLTDKLEILAYSEEHLNKHANIEDIWKTVTLCKYSKGVPEIKDKVKSRLQNDLYKLSTIEYYYKNFQVTYEATYNNGYVECVEKSSFTIVRPTTEPFWFDFKTTKSNVDPNAKTDVSFACLNEPSINFASITPSVTNSPTEEVKHYSQEMSGHKEYHFEGEVRMVQNLQDDRYYSFSARRVIDDLTINISPGIGINVTFVPVGGYRFYPNNAATPNVESYINRDILLGGQKFILFFHQ